MRIWWLLAALVAIGTVVAELVAGPYGYFHWHFIPAFDLAFGFAGCWAIVVLSKAAGAWFLQRPEGYTPEGDPAGDGDGPGRLGP
jgi:hypothetical protein